MENYKPLLELLYNELLDNFLTKKEFKKKIIDEGKDLLSVIISSSMNDKSYREFIENKGISLAQLRLKLDDNSEIIDESLANGYIKKCQLFVNKNKYHLTLKGLHLYLLISSPSYNFLNVLDAFESYRMPDQVDLKISKYEKLIVIFLIIVGADCIDNALLLKSPEFDKKCFNLLKLIEAKCLEKEFDLGTKIVWGKGKNIGFKNFLGNNDKLPKTMVFKKVNNGFDGYFLDFNTLGNTNLIIDLISGNLDAYDKYMFNLKFKNILFELSLTVSDILEEVTPEINPNLLKTLNA